MKWWILFSLLLSVSAHAEIANRVILKCKNAGKNRTLKIEESVNGQTYGIIMTDYVEKELIGASYVLKSKDVSADSKNQNFTVARINGTEENYSIQIQPLYATNEPESYLGDFATIGGWSVAGSVSAKEKVFKTLVPESTKFDMQVLECTN